MCVLQQVQQRLLHLRGIDRSMQCALAHLEAEVDLALQATQELAPVDLLQAWLRQLGEARVAADEPFQVSRAFLDGGEDVGEALHLSAPHELRAGVRQRRDWRQRVVQFMG